MKMKLALSLLLVIISATISVRTFRLNRNETDTDNLNYSGRDDGKTPVRFEGTQLWRIYKNSRQLPNIFQQDITNPLETNFGGNVWRYDSNFVDMSIDKANLNNARNFLNERNISSDILHKNIQNLIDEEEIIGATARENIRKRRKSHRAKKSIIDNSSSGMHWDDYHDLDVIYNYMRELRNQFPKICRLYDIGNTSNSNGLKVLRITENPGKFKKIWIDGGIHAREWISPAVVTYIAHTLLTNWETLPSHMKTKTWYIMPVMNPDGYNYSRKVNRLWRKNRSSVEGSSCLGTDLNRNFDIGWDGPGSSEDPCLDIFRGVSRASELETQAVVNFLTKRKINLGSYMTFHSYGQMIVYPWAYKAEKVEDARELQNVADEAAKNVKLATGTQYRTSVTHRLLGVAGGGSDDWSRHALNAKYVYTVELRDRGFYGFVLPPSMIRDTAKEGYTIVYTIAQFV